MLLFLLLLLELQQQQCNAFSHFKVRLRTSFLEMRNIVIFTDNCLRLHDNPALNHAIKYMPGESITPVYLPSLSVPSGDVSDALACVQAKLRAKGCELGVMKSHMCVEDVVDAYLKVGQPVTSITYCESEIDHVRKHPLRDLQLSHRSVRVNAVQDSLHGPSSTLARDLLVVSKKTLIFPKYKYALKDIPLPVSEEEADNKLTFSTCPLLRDFTSSTGSIATFSKEDRRVAALVVSEESGLVSSSNLCILAE